MFPRIVFRKLKALIIGALGLAVLCMLWLLLKQESQNLVKCNDSKSVDYLDQLCSNYSNGLVAGSICTPLCLTREIRFTKCLGHGVKVHVLSAEWKDATVILKAKRDFNKDIGISYALRTLPNSEDFNEATYSISKQEFIQHVHLNIEDILPKDQNEDFITQTIDKILSECDVGNDELFWFEEATACWQLLETREYLLSMVLKENSAMPQVLGTCGSLFAVQFAPTAPFLNSHSNLAEVRSWEFRARLALALLEMVESLEETVLGTLYLCDVQESNFGVVKKWDGNFVAKAIDMDISYFEDHLISTAVYERNNSCSTNDDCSFISCSIECDANTNKCSGVLSSSNLQSVCSLLFKKNYFQGPALLVNPPKSVASQLNQLLDKCSELGSSHVDWNLLKQLEATLKFSISLNSVHSKQL